MSREVCMRCRRPTSACYCAHVTPIETRTRLVLLQHPRERDMPIGTARMASLCLTRSDLLVGVDWSHSTALAAALADPARTPILLYPGEGAIDIAKDPPAGPVTLIVVDGTWSQTKKVVRTNPVLAALPRYAFAPSSPSEYRIRKEPDVAFVATIEALVHALTALEGGTTSFDALLTPFRAMVDHQIACAERFQGSKPRHASFRARPRRMRVPRILTERTADLVCVAGEANAWPHPSRVDPGRPRDELVHWTAFRPSSGEVFDFVVAPRLALAPRTTKHIGIDEETLLAGRSLAELDVAWRAFLREGDVVCTWGGYETTLFAANGGYLPYRRVDLRHVARDFVRGPAGTLVAFCQRVAPDGRAPVIRGRAGRKLAGLADALDALIAATA